MGLGNLNPGFQNPTSSYVDYCSCCCDATAHAGVIRRSFYPWIRKIRLISPQGSVELDPPNSTDTWLLSKTDTYDPSSFGLTVESGDVLSPFFSCQVEWYGYGPTAGRYRDNTCTGLVTYKPVANHSVIVQFRCINNRPQVQLVIGTSIDICVQLFNTPGGGFVPATDPILNTGVATNIRHGTSHLFLNSTEVDGSTYPIALIPVVGAVTFNPDMGTPGGIAVPSYGPLYPTLPPTKIFYSYGESVSTVSLGGSIVPNWNALGILGLTVELIP